MRPEELPILMRAQLNSLLPEKAFLRRDRRDALFISNAPAFDPDLRELPGFSAEIQGKLMRILPDVSWIERMEENDSADHFASTLLRFRGQKPDMENLKLFALGAKLLEEPAAIVQSDGVAYDRMLRQRAAAALRGGCGGGLYACALLNSKIMHDYKGEDTI